MPATFALDIYGTLIDPLAVKTALVSSNPFDVIGAAACGGRTVWIKRSSKAIFDPWEHKPSAIISDLKELSALPVFLEDAP